MLGATKEKIKIKLPVIPGTKQAIKNAQLLISTGIPFLDNIIGLFTPAILVYERTIFLKSLHFVDGGLPIGSIFLIEEDKYGFYAKIVLKYFMAEGVVTSQPILIASQDIKPSTFVSELPAVISDTEPCTKTTDKVEEQMKIAWRYQNMRLVDSSPTGSQIFGHYYDLTKSMPEDILASADIKQWHENNLQKQSDTFQNTAYTDLLYTIQETLHNGQYFVSEAPDTNKKILRIAVHSLGSRLWLSDTEESSNCDLLKFIYCFRALLRNAYAVGVITIPVNNFDNDTVIKRIEHMSDIAIKLESFAESAKETNPLYKDYHGRLHIKKLSALNALASNPAKFKDLVFKLRRKKFVIEILHLPPEFEDTAQREQDESVTSTTGCMSGSHRNIDF